MAGINTLELDPTKENIYKTLVDDAVGRNKDLWQFAGFCTNQGGKCSIALDGGWGTGKTFFLKQLEMLFNSDKMEKNEQREISKAFAEIQNKSKIAKTLKPRVCIYYDAWLNDNAEDPMRSLLYEIITKSDANLFESKDIGSKIKKYVNGFLKKYLFSPSAMELAEAVCMAFDKLNLQYPTGGVVPFLEYFKKNNPVRDIEAQKRFQDAFEAFLNKVMNKGKKRLVILIDELDRCKPTYAVQLLERIKHYLSNDRITFVFSLNEKELQHTIKAFYGDQFSGYRYLDRFFDVRFSLPNPEPSRFIKLLQLDDKNSDSYIYKSTCETFIEVYSLSIREAIKYCRLVEFVCGSLQNDQEKKQDRSWRFVMYIIVPIVLGLRFVDDKILSGFLRGDNGEPLKKIVLSSDILMVFLKFIQTPLKDDYTNNVLKANQDQKAIIKLNAIYDYLFVCNLQCENQIESFPFTFSRDMLDTIFHASTLMADFIKFDTNTEEPAHG